MVNSGTELVLDTLRTVYPHLLPGALANLPPTDIGIDPNSLTAAEFGEFAAPGRWDTFVDAVARVGGCANPVKVVGHSTRINPATGEVLGSYSSSGERSGVTYLPCGNRREARCLHCSRLYRADVFHLVKAGVCGGKTVPDRVADNPLVFATFTAPSFGKVHTRRSHTGLCHPGTHGPALCSHGKPRTCGARHRDGDKALGQALCLDCYDFASQIIWQYWAPKLWGRFTMTLRRAVAKDLGIAATKVHEAATVQFVKVAEEQDRAAIHYHALIRLDGPRTPDGFEPAPDRIDAHRLTQLIKQAAGHVRLTVPGVDLTDPERTLAFGRQLDTKTVSAASRGDDPDRELSAAQVGGYLGKYVTKSAGDDPTRANTPHQTRLRTTIRTLGARSTTHPDPELREVYRQLRRRIDDNAYRGHRTSKSKRFSVTLGALRRARRRAARLIAQANLEQRRLDLAAIENELLADDTDTTITLGHWRYAGQGWNTNAETTLATACAARAREYDREKAAARTANNGSRKETSCETGQER